jgi:MFS family permease
MTQNNKTTWDTAYEWRAVALLSIGFGLVGLDRFMIQPLFPVMMRDLGLTYQDLGYVSGVLALAWGLSALCSGWLADRVGHRKILIPATIVFSLLAGLSGLATGVGSLMVMRGIMGVSEGAFTPASIVATLDASKPTRHGQNLGIQQNMVALVGLGLAPLIVTQLLRVVPSWRWVFLMVSVPGFVVAYLMYRVLRDTDAAQAAIHTPTHDASAHRWTDIFKFRNVPLNMLGMLCWLTVLTVMGAFFPNYLIDHLHLSLPQMGFVMSAIGFGGSAGNLVMPALSDRIGRRPVLIIGVIVGVACLVALIHTGPQPLKLFFLVFFTMWSVFANVTLTVGPLTVESVPAKLMTTASGIVVGTGEVFGGGVAPTIGGYIAQHIGIQNILYVAISGMALGIVVAVSVKETAPRIQFHRTRPTQDTSAP